MVQKSSEEDEISFENRYGYTSEGRLEKVYQTTGPDAEQLLSAFEYNALGQLVDKKKGGHYRKHH